MSKFKIYFLLLAIGFVFIALDMDIETVFQYPNEYANSDEVIGEFQYYNIASNYNARCTYKLIDANKNNEENSSNIQNSSGTTENSTVTQQGTKVIDKIYFKNIEIDIFNDSIGFLLIFIACLGLRKASRKFKGAATTSVFALILHCILFMLPFLTNGLALCNSAMVIGIAYLLCTITTTYLFTNGLLSMCKDVCCRDERKWCLIIWYVTCILQCLITFVFWLGSDFKPLHNLGIFCEAVLVLLIIIFWIVLHRTYDYLEASYHNASQHSSATT